jgi:uncharacterized protein involved in type VI secretion and phage assembly
VTSDVQAALVQFQADTRLYDLELKHFAHERGQAVAEAAQFTVEAFTAHEALNELGELRLLLLSPRADVELAALLGCGARLCITLADGQRSTWSGLVRQVECLASEGGLARYQLHVVPWLWLTTQHSRQRVFQDKTTLDILDQVWQHYQPQSQWIMSDEVAGYLEQGQHGTGGGGVRPYTVQYGQTDYEFVQQLLAEEGLIWVVEEDHDALHGHRVRLLADSCAATYNSASPVRFHRASSQEAGDAIQALGSQRQLQNAVTTVLSYDYQSKRSVAASLPSRQPIGGAHAPVMEDYRDTGAQTFSQYHGAQRHAELRREATEARQKTFFGRSTVRSARAGTRFELTQSDLDNRDNYGHSAADRCFLWTRLQAVGLNNLPKAARDSLSTLFGRAQDALTEPTAHSQTSPTSLLPPMSSLWPQAQASGYANGFEALRSYIPWRPAYLPPPQAPGPMSARVTGPEGRLQADGTQDIWCDALGRIKVRFHWQAGTEADDRDSCWLPVMQRQAGPGYGWQLLPRIGQEVLVDFIGGNLRQPLVLGSLYNGQGEVPQDAQATDHRPAGQGNLTGGHSPAWHGTGAAEHHHAGALSGFKDAEFGGSGHNRLVFDDSPRQLRTQLATTQSASELTLGHLIHQADNYRGSYRGSGFELRTQAYGAIRGGRGVLITTWRKSHGHPQTDPAGEASGVIALLRHATTLAQAFHQVSTHHQGVGLSAHAGSHKAQASSLDPQAAPLAAWLKVARGMVAQQGWTQAAADAQNKNQQVSADKVPHFTDPVVVLGGKSGLAEIAGQQRISAAGESVVTATGQHLNVAIQGHWQLRSGQALSWVAGVTQAGPGHRGLELLASQGEVKVQAQAGTLTLASQQGLRLASQDGPVRLVAAKAIHIKTQAGARISIEGGNIEIHAPGTLTIHKSSLNKQGPESLSVAMNQ